jgi:uncharacterized protein YxjI
MHEVLSRNVFLIKEHVGAFKAANNYDIYDAESGDVVLHCREPNLGVITRILRFTDYKRFTPFDVHVTTPDGSQVLRAERGAAFLRSHVTVKDEAEQKLGSFRQRILSIGGAFEVLDEDDQTLCELKGKWTGWDFRFVAGAHELAHVTKKWAGVGKELFTSADNYVLEISPAVPADSAVRQLILSAVLCIDMVLKE